MIKSTHHSLIGLCLLSGPSYSRTTSGRTLGLTCTHRTQGRNPCL